MTYLLAPGRCVLRRCAWSQVLGAARRVRLSSCWWICRERGISFFHWASLCITSEVPSARDAPTVCGGGKARLLLLGRWRGTPAWSQVGGDVGLLLSPGGSGGSRLALAHYLQLLCELGVAEGLQQSRVHREAWPNLPPAGDAGITGFRLAL